jgi:hypothetical protein
MAGLDPSGDSVAGLRTESAAMALGARNSNMIGAGSCRSFDHRHPPGE